MRLPAVAIATAFACGIALRPRPAVARNGSSHILLSSFFIFIGVLVLIGIILVRIILSNKSFAASLLAGMETFCVRRLLLKSRSYS